MEVIQGINEAPISKCPKCNRRKVKKLISESSFQLKGSGWYATDYAKGNGGNGNGKKKPAEHTESSDKSDSASAKESSAKESSAKESPAKESPAKSADHSASPSK